MLKKCTTVEEGVRNALEIFDFQSPVQWRYVPAQAGQYTDRLVLGGKEYPLFWWRCDPQVGSMYAKAPSRKLCSMKLNRVGAKSAGLEALLYKELDIAEWTMGSRIKTVMNFQKGGSMNMLATLENERVALFELAASLHDDTPEQGRHTYWGEEGMASDRVVSQKVASEAIYLFTDDAKDPQTFNDIFIYMYGLSRTDTLKAVIIAEILMGRRSVADWNERDEHYRKCIAAAAVSAQTVRRVEV